MRNAPETFTRKSDADRYLTQVEAQMARREWVDPDRAKVTLADYARRWIDQRPNLRPRTIHLYGWLLDKHIVPYLGGVELGGLDTPIIREWRAKLLGNGVSVSMAAKAYRLLRAVLMTAVKEDEILTRNPCRIPGAEQEKPAERPVLTLAQVFKLADIVPPRYRALVLVTTFGCLRSGEVAALNGRTSTRQRAPSGCGRRTPSSAGWPGPRSAEVPGEPTYCQSAAGRGRRSA